VERKEFKQWQSNYKIRISSIDWWVYHQHSTAKVQRIQISKITLRYQNKEIDTIFVLQDRIKGSHLSSATDISCRCNEG